MCLSHSRRDILLKLLGGHFSDRVVQKVKDGRVFCGTGDNWDLKILKGHMRKNIQNEDLHLFASNLIENRLNFGHLPNEHPKGNTENFPRCNFSLNVNERQSYAASAKILLGRIVLEFFSKVQIFEICHPCPHPPCTQLRDGTEVDNRYFTYHKCK